MFLKSKTNKTNKELIYSTLLFVKCLYLDISLLRGYMRITTVTLNKILFLHNYSNMKAKSVLKGKIYILGKKI
jgi:hypothetical protein